MPFRFAPRRLRGLRLTWYLRISYTAVFSINGVQRRETDDSLQLQHLSSLIKGLKI